MLSDIIFIFIFFCLRLLRDIVSEFDFLLNFCVILNLFLHFILFYFILFTEPFKYFCLCFIYSSFYLYIYIFLSLCMYLLIDLSIYLFIYLFIYPFIYSFIYSLILINICFFIFREFLEFV